MGICGWLSAWYNSLTRNLAVEESPTAKIAKRSEAEWNSPETPTLQSNKIKTPKSAQSKQSCSTGRWVTTPSTDRNLITDSEDSNGFEESEVSGWPKKGVSRPPPGSERSLPSTQNELPGDEQHPPPSMPTRKPSHAPEVSGEQDKPEVTSLIPLTQRPVRLPPVAIAEGSILEVADDMSACSDITDNFSWEPLESEYAKRAKIQGLGRIDEANR